MLKKKVEEALNNQIEVEAFSSQLYLSMASWCNSNGFPGAAQFLYTQTEEERLHMLKIFHYINEKGGHAVVPALKKPQDKFKSVINIFEEVLKHEQYVTSTIDKLMEVCMTEKDYTTANFLQWYVNEQIEEESTAQGIIDRIKLIGKEPSALYLIDVELENILAKKLKAAVANTAQK
ncbi:MAG: ferritin [Bacteroidetes bacterium GWE2_29_8]|nr:MAG: ferritin [Bacteroidetes bacterium GWE2_29_8]